MADELNTQYLLVGYADGHIELVDSETLDLKFSTIDAQNEIIKFS